MTIFDNFKAKNKAKNIDELADWLYEHCNFDDAPWWKYWDENYCGKCDGEVACVPELNNKEMEFAWCELHDKCRFFQDMNDIPSEKQIVKMWLESEIE